MIKNNSYDEDCHLLKKEKNLVVKVILRNNQWMKHQNVFETIKFTKKIICPFGHTKDSCLLFKEGKFNNENYSHIFINDLKIDDIVLVFDKNYKKSLVVKIKSEPLIGKLKDILIIRNNICKQHTKVKSNCILCKESIVKVCSTKFVKDNIKTIIENGYLGENYRFEYMYAIYRDIQILYFIKEDTEVYQKYKYIGIIGKPATEVKIPNKSKIKN